MHPVLKFSGLQAPNDNEGFGAFVQRACGGKVTWQQFARFNWGTDNPFEVNRWLAETVGLSQIDVNNPANSVCLKERGRNMNLRVPQVYEAAALSLDKNHTISVRKRRPANAIRITTLSPWFLPGFEACDLTYGLEGLRETADQVSMEVWASNYCKATPVADGALLQYQYAALDIPVFQKDLTGPGQSDERATPAIADYRGESTAADGVLKKTAGADRYLNAANSPYAVVLKYYKQAADKKARILIGDFWPQFQAAGTVDPASLQLKWKAKDCSRLQYGLVQVYDGQNNLVWWKALQPADFSDGDHQFDWNTWVSGSGYNVTKAKLPYRVQIQGHTPFDEANGLAIVAMQTEVRMFQHDGIGVQPAAQRHTEPQCLELSLAPLLPVRTATSPNADVLPKEGSLKWYKLKLAEAGYQPGPTHEETDSDHLKLALAEFQRCVPKSGGPPYKRLKADAKRGAATKTVLANVPASSQRALFATTARVDQTLAQAGPVLNQPGSDLVVWVENRHYYTDLDAAAKKGLPDPRLALENYGGGMSLSDNDRLTKIEAKSVARPWIPLQVRVPLLTKADTLLATGAALPNYRPEMLAACGPLRVDWKFTELDPDYSTIDNANYNSDGRIVTRTRRFIRETITTLAAGATHNGLPVANCPSTHGGIRTAANYYREPFGRLQESLAPWRAVEDGPQETVCTLLHDELGQAKDKIHPTHRGYAGVYFHPSRIAGDGYRLQVNVSLQKHPGAGEDHPNRALLARRYTNLPQAHSCTLRLWRKTIFRGYSEWSTANPIAYAAFSAHTAHQYEAAFVHFAHESNAPQLPPLPLNPVIPDDLKKYRSILDAGMTRGGKRAWYPKSKKMSLSQANHWPFLNESHYGLPWRKYNLTLATFRSTLLNNVLNQTIYQYSDNLMFELLYRIEKSTGHFAGHYSVLWQAVPQLWQRNYICDAAGHHVVLAPERLQAEQAALGTKCTQCAGHLQLAYVKWYQCANGHGFRRSEANAAVDANPACPTCGAAVGPHPVAQNPPHGNEDVTRFRGQGFSEPAIGQALGTLWLYFDTTLTGNGNRMAHEYGHNRHLEHTPSVDPAAAPPYDPTQHDTMVNTTIPFTAQEVAGLYNQWDHRCMMSYCPDPTPGGDKDPLRYFCGKCALKHRGWRVTNIAPPAGGLGDP